MKMVGNVEIPQEAFLSVLKMNEEWYKNLLFISFFVIIYTT
jgi:hypothetical protein